MSASQRKVEPPRARRETGPAVVNGGWPVVAAAQRWQVDAKTVPMWRDRRLADGDDRLADRSSRPRSCQWARRSPPQIAENYISGLGPTGRPTQ